MNKDSINILFRNYNIDFNTYQKKIKNKIISNFENLLKEDNYLYTILLPDINN